MIQNKPLGTRGFFFGLKYHENCLTVHNLISLCPLPLPIHHIVSMEAVDL